MTLKAKIIGTGSYLPQRVLSNSDLEKMVETSDEWIFSRTGMRERRIAGSEEFTSSMGAEAARAALADARIQAEEIDFILVATSDARLFLSEYCVFDPASDRRKKSGRLSTCRPRVRAIYMPWRSPNRLSKWAFIKMSLSLHPKSSPQLRIIRIGRLAFVWRWGRSLHRIVS